MLPFKIKLTTFIHQTYLDIISPNLYILYFKSFCWYFVVEKPNSRYCFASSQEKKILLCPQTIIKEHYMKMKNYSEGQQHCLVEAHPSDEWYKTKNTLDWTNFIFKIRLIWILKTLPLICKFQKHVQTPTPLSIKQKDTHVISHYHYHGKDAIFNCLRVHYPCKFILQWQNWNLHLQQL